MTISRTAIGNAGCWHLEKKKINFLLQKELRFEDKFHMRWNFSSLILQPLPRFRNMLIYYLQVHNLASNKRWWENEVKYNKTIKLQSPLAV